MKHSFLLALMVLMCGLRAVAVDIVAIQVRDQEGNPVDAAAVTSFIQPEVGDEYDPRIVNADIRRLEATGRYAYVGAELVSGEEGLVLVYVVEERPRLRRIVVRGGGHFSNVRIREWMELNLSDRVDETIVTQKLDVVREKYQKDFYPDVSFDIELAAPDEDGFTSLTITVDEGARRKVKNIRFPGRIAYSRTQLKRAMGQKETWLFSFWTGRGNLDLPQLRQDLSTLEELYRDKGYLDAKAGPVEILQEGEGLTLKIPIQPFTKYKLNSIRIEGNTLYPDSLLGAQIPVQVGGPASSSLLTRGARDIRDYYNNRGFSKTRVSQQVLLTSDPNRVDVVYTVDEGRVAEVRNVLIRGNTRTKDHVIRRELLVVPGDTLNEVRVRRSVSRLRNLGFFESANYTLIPTDDPTVYDVEFDVREGRSGQFLAGMGFSSEDKIVGFIEMSQGNFDLTDPPGFAGGGEKLKARIQLGTERRDMELTYSRPWFLDRRMTLSLAMFQNEREFLSDDYDQRNTGGSIGLRKALGDQWRGGITYKLEEIEVFNVSETAAEFVQSEEGQKVRSGLDFTLTRDTRNKIWVPTKGGRLVFSSGFTGGPLGFDEDIYELGVRSSYFFPVVWDHTLNLHGWARTVDYYGDSNRVPIFDRLFLGGSRTIRAFEFRDVSPVDGTGEPVGGQSMLFGSAEYTIPLSEMFRYAMFYDWGVVNADSFDPDTNDANASYGVGLRIDMPGFPLRFDYSWPHLTSEHNDSEGGRFSFLIGYSF